MEFKRVTELLDKAVKDVPEKVGFVDIDGEMTYQEMYDISIRIAKAIICATGEDPAKIGEKEPQPVATLIEAGNDLAACMHGILYAGDYYSCIDETMPNERIEKIFETLEPVIILTNRETEEKAREIHFDGTVLVYEDILEQEEADFDLPMIVEEEVSQKLARRCVYFRFDWKSEGRYAGPQWNPVLLYCQPRRCADHFYRPCRQPVSDVLCHGRAESVLLHCSRSYLLFYAEGLVQSAC